MKNILVLAAILLSYPLVAQQPEKPKEPENRGYAVTVGDMAPNFEVKYLDGLSKQLSDFRGKIVMLQFTASWCGVCRKEMPHIEAEIWQVYKGNPNFALIGIDLKEDAETIRKFAEKVGVSYPIVFDSDGAIFAKYTEENAGVTRNIIIDRDGKITFLTRLYNEEEFNAMKAHIAGQLAK